MDKLNRVINLGSDEKITYEDIGGIIDHFYDIQTAFENAYSEYTANPDLDYTYKNWMKMVKMKAKYLRNVLESIYNKFINANNFLEVAVKKCASVEGMILVALPLRYGANPNHYVVMKKVGYIHIMVYTIYNLRGVISNEMIEMLLYLMSVLGSSTASRVMKNRDNDELFERYEEQDMMVADWLNEQGYNNMVDFDIDSESQVLIGTMADKPEIAFPGGYDPIVTLVYDTNGILVDVYENGIRQGMDESVYTPPGPDIMQLVMYNAYECARYASIPKSYSAGEIKELRLTINTGAMEVFKILIDRGFNFSYFSMNRLLSNMKKTVENAPDGETIMVDRFFNIIYMEMLKYVISKGLKMDKEQFSFLSNFSTEYAEKIEEIYKSPAWIKSCSGSSNIPLPEMVKSLAFSLGIDATNPKPEVCASLKDISLQNSRVLKDAAYNRQKIRTALNNLSAEDMANGETSITCKNITGDKDPLKYVDGSLAVYTDSNKNTWCFTAPDFEKLLETPINPVSGQPLPEYFIKYLSNSLETFQKAGIRPYGIIPFDEALDKLKEQDKINNTNIDYVISTISDLGKIRGVHPSYLRNTKLETMHIILKTIDMDQDYLGSLSRTLQFNTFCKALYAYVKRSRREDIDIIFEFIMP
jgi:hypothetical protein